MTAVDADLWCKTCELHRTDLPDRPCPVCRTPGDIPNRPPHTLPPPVTRVPLSLADVSNTSVEARAGLRARMAQLFNREGDAA